jgi:hypothetical protein
MKIRHLFVGLVLLAGIGGLVGCGTSSSSGDGGGGVPDGYTGATFQTPLDPVNAPAVTDNVANFNDPSGLIVVGQTARSTGGDNSGRPSLRGIAQVRSITDKVRTIFRRAGEYYTEPGYSGSYTVDSVESGNTSTGTITFNNYVAVPGADTVNGILDYTGSYTDTGSTLKFTINFSIYDYLYVGAERISGRFKAVEYFELDALLNVVYSKVTLTMNMLYENIDFALYYSNVVVTDEEDFDAGYSTTTLDGRIYDSEFGYVDVETTTPVVADMIDDSFVEGTVMLWGAEGSSVWLEFTGVDIIARLEIGDDNLYDEGTWYVN